MSIKAANTIIDGFPVAVTSDMGYMDDTSDMGTGVADRRAWNQAELDRIARRARLGVTADRVVSGASSAPAPVATAAAGVAATASGAAKEAAAEAGDKAEVLFNAVKHPPQP